MMNLSKIVFIKAIVEEIQSFLKQVQGPNPKVPFFVYPPLQIGEKFYEEAH